MNLRKFTFKQQIPKILSGYFAIFYYISKSLKIDSVLLQTMRKYDSHDEKFCCFLGVKTLL